MPGSWESLQHQPTFWPGPAFLLTDGSVMCNEWQTRRWWRLWPDAQGQYANSPWQPAASMREVRIFYCASVLADGRLMVGGGYWSKPPNYVIHAVDLCEIYDPASDVWHRVDWPRGFFGDTPTSSCVLADGRLVVGSSDAALCKAYDPLQDHWSDVGANTKEEKSTYEEWTLLPNGNLFAIESIFPMSQAQSYVPANDTWVTVAPSPVSLTDGNAYGEAGTAIVLTDGRVCAIGSTGHIALFTPGDAPADAGSWTIGPDFPFDKLPSWSMPGCLLPNGNVFFAAGSSPYGGTRGDGTSFYEFNTQVEFPELEDVSDPFGRWKDSAPPYQIRMLLLPTGQVLELDRNLNNQSAARLYNPDGGPLDAWRPTITTHPSSIKAGSIYPLRGQQINGLSPALCHGKMPAGATNYPLVRLHNPGKGKIWYCPTANHSSMGVATGTSIQSTNFLVPNGVDIGKMELYVIANGIASAPVTVNVQPAEPRYAVDGGLVNILIGSRADGPLWGLGPNGPVPIGPFNGRLQEEARAAYQSIIDGLRALEKIGRAVLAKRTEAALKEPGPTEPNELLDRHHHGSKDEDK